jgi:hypothetical protein
MGTLPPHGNVLRPFDRIFSTCAKPLDLWFSEEKLRFSTPNREVFLNPVSRRYGFCCVNVVTFCFNVMDREAPTVHKGGGKTESFTFTERQAHDECNHPFLAR